MSLWIKHKTRIYRWREGLKWAKILMAHLEICNSHQRSKYCCKYKIKTETIVIDSWLSNIHIFCNIKAIVFITTHHILQKIRKERLKEENLGSHKRCNASELV